MAPTKTKRFSAVKPPRKAQQDSKLMNLPPEIRNRIYEQIFNECDIYIGGGKRQGLHYDKMEAPGILLSCRQTHVEALRIYYSIATFTFDELWTAECWCKAIGSIRERWLRYIRIDSPYDRLRVRRPGQWATDRNLSSMTLQEIGDWADDVLEELEEITYIERRFAEVQLRTESKRLGRSKEPKEVVRLFIEYSAQRQAEKEITAPAEELKWLEEWYNCGPFRL